MTEWTAVFLDRDGTINRAPDPSRRYVLEADELELLPGAGPAIRRLNAAGIWVGVVTNQQGIGRGEMTERDLDAIHDRLAAELARHDAHLDALYVCPHLASTCGCRKPEPGLLDRAFAEHPHLDRERSLLIGDQVSDMQCAERAGITGIRIADPDAAAGGSVARSLSEAVDRVVAIEVAR